MPTQKTFAITAINIISMNWLTTIWTSFITLSLAMSAFYLVRWLRRREWLYLMFVLLGISIAGQAASEIGMFRATSVEEYGLALRQCLAR